MLSNEVKYISEFQVVFHKIAKGLTKCPPQNPGVQKLNFPIVKLGVS